MGDGEQLDVLGLVKRLAGDNPDQFTPTTRIAIDPWVREIKKTEQEQTPPGSTLADIRRELERHQDALMNAGLMTKVGGNEEIYKDMPFDAGLLYRSVLEAHIQKSKNEGREREENILRGLGRGSLKDAWTTYRQPCPYYAMLLADGDHMGALIKAAEGKKQHQEISNACSRNSRNKFQSCRKNKAGPLHLRGRR